MSAVAVAAVDLGATSGRVMMGQVGPEVLSLHQVARFANGPTRLPDGLHWNVQELYAHIVEGLAAGSRQAGAVKSIGIDSWAVDYALLRAGRVLGEPFHYRDERTAAGVEAVHAVAPFAELYARNGLQFLPFNTLYQLAVERDAGMLEVADRALLVPDLIAYLLTGAEVAERTNASTTGLLNVSTGAWDLELAARLGLPSSVLPPLTSPGERIGALLPHVADATGLSADVPVIAVGSHDTASAVVATPMTEPGGAYISCGTWGLVGVETERPVLTDAAREANFTNEGGVDGRTRFLHNVTGLWLLSETMRTWAREGQPAELRPLLAAAADVTATLDIFDANDPVFAAPGDMPGRIATWLRERGRQVPSDQAQMVRCIIESLAQAFTDATRDAARLSGQSVTRIYITGGGSLNELLCQRVADRSGLPVLAGPVEATALGNVLIQGRALGAVSGSLESLRDLISRCFTPRRHNPQGH